MDEAPASPKGARRAAPSDMHIVRVTATSDQTYEFELPDDWAVIVEVDGRQYVGVTMSSEDHPVEVVYWPDEDGDDNITVTPPGVPTDWPDETVDSEGNFLPRGRCDMEMSPESNGTALQQISEMLQNPDWGEGMLEDIRDIVERAGYETRTGYYLLGSLFHDIADYNEHTRGAMPIDPDVDLDQLIDSGERGHWRQTGETIHDGLWTRRDRATIFREVPDTSKIVHGRRVDGFPYSEFEAIDTWGRH